MRALVVFFSLEGNTRSVAEAVAEETGADVIELLPVSVPSSTGFSKFFRGGKSAMMKEAPELKPLNLDPAGYDLVFLGSPVWAWTYAPPIRSFLKEHDLSGKKVALFMCHGGGPGKAAEKLTEAVQGAVLGKLLLQDPLKADREASLAEIRRWTERMIERAQTLS